MYLFFGLIVFCHYSNAQPYAVTNLSASQGYFPHQIKLNWTYPGPDILPPGSKYFIQRSTWTDVTWEPNLAQITISTGPVKPSEKQTWIVTSLSGGATYYFHLWISSGPAEILSEISNRATHYLVPDAVISLTKNYSSTQERPGDIVTYTIVYENIGNIAATNTVIQDKIPQHCDYHPGSIIVDGQSKTDAQDDEPWPRADYTNEIISVRFGEIKLLPGTTGYIEFKVRIR